MSATNTHDDFSSLQFGAAAVPNACWTAIGSGLRLPATWGEFIIIDSGATAITVLPRETLTISSEDFDCDVLDVSYDDYQNKTRGIAGSVRYWLSHNDHFVRRIRFTQIIGPALRVWTATVERMTFGEPETQSQDLEPNSSGKTAPDILLPLVDEKQMHLSDLRGKTVILDFWATWCFACNEQVPILEQLRSEYKDSQIVVLGVTHETADYVRKWRRENKKSFRSAVEAQDAFDSFDIHSFPFLVVIDPNGIVADRIFGLRSKSFLKNAITSALQK